MNILAIGAHPDDIEFGCGGTLLKFSNRGHGIYLYIATHGELGGDPDVRMTEQEDAARFIGVKKIFWGGYEDTKVPAVREVIEKIESVINEVQPSFIFVHNCDDTHQDHRILSALTVSATRYIRNFLFYEVPTTQNFTPTVFVDITDVLDKKFELLRKHESQVDKINLNVRDLTISEIARSSALFRGIQGRVRYAEGFTSLRLFLEID